jgi:hypothetical protein
LRPPQLAAFLSGGQLVVHRVLRRRLVAGRLEIREKGDAQRIARWLDGGAILGRVIAVRRGASRRDLTRGPWALCNLALGVVHIILDAAMTWRHRGAGQTDRASPAGPPGSNG